MRDPAPSPPRRGLSARHLPALGALGLLCACATGVDITEDEFAEICADPGAQCPDEVVVGNNGGSGPSGNGGSGQSFGGSTNGGSFNAGGSGTGFGGTSSSNGGSTSGSGGGSSPPLPPLAEGTCLMGTDQVVINYTDRSNGSSSANQASMTLSVVNNGASFNLPDLTIRYWFTDDGAGDFNNCSDCANVDYAAQSGGASITDAVTVTFGEESGSNYAEIGFESGNAVGPEGVEQVQLRVHTSNYQTLNQANDFSFLAGATAAPNRNITPYVNGTQVGGCVPIAP